MINIKFINATSVQLVDQAGNIVSNVGEFTSPTEFYYSGDTFSKGAAQFYKFVIEGTNVELSGTIGTVTKDYQYFNLFKGQTAISNATYLILSSTTAKKFCFANMFLDCTNLTTPPQIQASTLDEWCYSSMFGNCSSLTAVPTLPATGLAPYCYYCMFYGCKSLSSAPYLSAQTLQDWCYNSMFYDCKNLTSISADFNSWSENATTNWVTGIKTEGKFYNMNVEPIYGVDNIPENWRTQVVGSTLTFTAAEPFAVKINKNLMYRTTIDSVTSDWQVYNANSWIKAKNPGMKVELSGNNKAVLSAINTNFSMSGNANVTVYGNPRSLIFWGDLTENCFAKLFSGCTQLVDASNLILDAETLTPYCYDGMFERCANLTAVPILSSTTLANGCYQGMFNNCTSLTGVPRDLLPTTNLAYPISSVYSYMFAYCTSLVSPPDLPATGSLWIENYQQMFLNCTSLTDAPHIYINERITNDSLRWMFSNCTSLSSITVDFIDWKYSEGFPQGSPTYGWVENVAPNGVFTKPSDLPEQHGISFIPNGWTVINK